MARLGRKLRTLLKDVSGGMAIWFALLTPAIVGVSALAMDVGRIYALENELQLAADAYARAAAFELDGRPDAIDRANQAASSLIANDQRFGNGGRSDVNISGLRFLSDLPASDTASITGEYETSNGSEARYVELTVSPETISTLLPASIVTGVMSIDLEAKAVAGAE